MKAALIGDGIAGSLTPAMHEAEGRALGLEYRYDRMDTTQAPWNAMSLSEMIDRAEAEGLAGLNITHPFKAQAVEYVSDLSETARTLGAINTIVFRDGARVGHNTDYIGFRSSLRSDFAGLRLGQVLQLGAGGAGKAVALALLDQGVSSLSIYDTDPARAEDLVARLRHVRPTAHLTALPALTAEMLAWFDGAVNATPLGMAAHPGMAIDPRDLARTAWVADIVYFPLDTALLNRARMCGRRAVTGAGMAAYQAVAGFALITGHTPDAARMRSFLDAALRDKARQPAVAKVV